MNVLLGIIGHSPVLDNYPLGPQLMKKLEERDWDEVNVKIENMTWSPIHVVQRLQDEKIKFEQAVLIGVNLVVSSEREELSRQLCLTQITYYHELVNF